MKCNLFQWWQSWILASLLQSSVPHDPSEIIRIWFAAQEISSYYQCLIEIVFFFFFFRILWQTKFKVLHFLKKTVWISFKNILLTSNGSGFFIVRVNVSRCFVCFGFSHSFPLVTFPVTLKLYGLFGPEMHHLLSQRRDFSSFSYCMYNEVSIIGSKICCF